MAKENRNAKVEYEQLTADIAKLCALIPSALREKFDGDEINWGHVGTAQYVRSQLVSVIAAFDYEDGDEDEARAAILDRIK